MMEHICPTCAYPAGKHDPECPAQLKKPNPLDVQVAGSHYKGKRIQPVEYIAANNLNFLEGCIVKRITRWRNKGGTGCFEDLEKIKHEIDLLMEMDATANPKARAFPAGAAPRWSRTTSGAGAADDDVGSVGTTDATDPSVGATGLRTLRADYFQQFRELRGGTET